MYRLYFAPNCGSYELLDKQEKLSILYKQVKFLGKGKYLIIGVKDGGEYVVDMQFIEGIQDKPKVKRKVKK